MWQFSYTHIYIHILIGGLEHVLWLSIQSGMSSSQLTNSYFSERLKPPTSIYIYIYIYTSWQIYPIIQLQLGENSKNHDTADTASFRSVALCQAAGICDDLEECTHFSITVTWREQLQKQPVFCHVFLAKKLSLNSARWIDLTLFNQLSRRYWKKNEET